MKSNESEKLTYYSLSLILVRKALDWGHVGLLRHAQVVEGVQRWAQHLHLDDFLKRQGCILNLKFIFPPPPFWLIIFPRLKFFIMRVCAPQVNNFQTFFLKFCIFKSIGKKICIFPPFFIPFQSFFSPNLLFGHIFASQPGGGGVKQKNIHPCINVCSTFKHIHFYIFEEKFNQRIFPPDVNTTRSINNKKNIVQNH